MNFFENHSLKPYNTFGISASSKLFITINSIEELQELLTTSQFLSNELLVLGGGSNILLTKNFNGLAVKNNLKGIELLQNNEEFVLVKCNAGEVWHEFVLWCIQKNYAGLENLSLIPGCTGASPMQNIGAYGVEIKDVFYELEALNIQSGELINFSKNECEFGYRESVFKRKLKNQFIITSVTFKLLKKPIFHTEYGAIKQELDSMKVTELSIKNISQAVINIRKSKLPNPSEIGNAGSFFKNPEVSLEAYQKLKNHFNNIVAYELENGNYKLAAGWLIEQCGLKGYRVGDAGVHKLQSLVLVNYGNASGNEIYNLSTHVIDSVKEKFNVDLEREVNVI
jgi:UDP-N-acetylmuramate dehydrogenase